jgi:hypothetical protein
MHTLGLLFQPVKEEPTMPCEERDRLTKLYFDAVTLNATAGLPIENKKSQAWREATEQTRAVCTDTLADLNAHRKEHDC